VQSSAKDKKLQHLLLIDKKNIQNLGIFSTWHYYFWSNQMTFEKISLHAVLTGLLSREQASTFDEKS